MAIETIKCPKCGTVIELSQAVLQNIAKEQIKSEREKIELKAKKEAQESVSVKIADLEQQLAEKNKKIEEIQQRELELRKRERKLIEKEENLEKESEARENELKEKMLKERKSIEEKAKKDAQEAQRIEIVDLKKQLEEQTERAKKAEQQELELRKKQREIEEKQKTFELEMNRKLDEDRKKIYEKILMEFKEKDRLKEEEHRLKDMEKDKIIADSKKQIEALNRKLEQGSQQLQGEVLELDLERLLKNEFPFDEIEAVAKGVKGADIIQTVKTQSGRICGKILWEAKRTKDWSGDWLSKLKDDQRNEKADLAVIVSEALPKGFHHFREIKGIWVSDIPSASSLAAALRMSLIREAHIREAQTGKEGKMEIAYNYLIGTEFKNRVEAIADAFITMKNDLDKEKIAMDKIWAKREKQIMTIISNIAGMRGDLEGIVGPSLPAIKLLELSSVSDSDNSSVDKKSNSVPN